MAADTPTQLPIVLPKPTDEPSASLFEAFQRRRTIREISATLLPIQVQSNLLWAAFGVNRTIGPFGLAGRTAASVSNSQEIELFVATRSGAFLYDALAHALTPIVAEDLRKLVMTPRQNIATPAPLQLIYVVDIRRLTHTAGFDEPGLRDREVQKSYYFVDTGLIAGNVYLFAAAYGLATWFHNCDKAALAARLHLHSEQKVLFAQSIGYPAEHSGHHETL